MCLLDSYVALDDDYVCESGDDMYVVFLMVWLVDGVVDGNDECCLICDW